MTFTPRRRSSTVRLGHSARCCRHDRIIPCSTRRRSFGLSPNIATGNAPQISALLQTGVFDHIAEEVISNDECIRIESHKIINNALSGASLKDRIAIIGSASFRALLVAASMQRASVAGMEGIEFVLNRGVDIDADELAAIVTALHGINWPVAQQHLERINGWLRRLEAAPLEESDSHPAATAKAAARSTALSR
jgi:hypothetical protein